jgi:hypothetical protein
MIPEQYKSNVQETSNNVTSTGFTIEVNESMFQMLTSNVYNDPILAVIREWSTNACDACIVAEKEVKFDVHLPTEDELYFSVRDYGTGLPPEDIVGLFSNLGASTKRGSNQLNGTFGIGRMAGLAVSDGFSIESFYKGTCYSYAISVQNGVPVTISLGDRATTEPNGLKLSVAVEVEDEYHYTPKAVSLYKYFDYKPTLNLPNLCIELDITEHISDDWFIKTTNDRYDSTNYVVMSQIAYAIPGDSKINTQGFRCLVMKAEPGTVAFNPGRESLSLTKETVKYLNTRFTEIKDEYVQSALVALSNGKGDKEINSIYNKLVEVAPYEVTQEIIVKPFYSSYLQDMASRRFANRVFSTDEFQDSCNRKVTLSHKGAYYKNAKLMSEDNPLLVNTFLNVHHVLVDLKTKFKAALNHRFDNVAVVYWLRQDKVEIEDFLEEAKKAIKDMGLEYELASNIVNKYSKSHPTIEKLSTEREGLYASKLNYNKSGFNKSFSIDADTADTGRYLYIKLNNTTPELRHNSFTLEDFMLAYTTLEKVNSMPRIRGVAKKYQAIADDLPNWVDFEDYILEKVKKTTFKSTSNIVAPNFREDIISYATVNLYPLVIQNYFFEIKDYRKFTKADDCIYETPTKNLLTSMGASFYEYTPTLDVDLDVLENDFPNTLEFFKQHYTYLIEPAKIISNIAKLEEYYALRPTQ